MRIDLTYHKTSDKSRAPDIRQATHRGWRFDSFVLIEAGGGAGGSIQSFTVCDS